MQLPCRNLCEPSGGSLSRSHSGGLLHARAGQRLAERGRSVRGHSANWAIHTKMGLVGLGTGAKYVQRGGINGSEGPQRANWEMALQVCPDALCGYLDAKAEREWTLKPPRMST